MSRRIPFTHSVCRKCEHSVKGEDNYWHCEIHGDIIPEDDVKACKDFWVSQINKVTGFKRASHPCIICGAPVYYCKELSSPYCEKHKGYLEKDNEIISNMSSDAIVSLVCGIFDRARRDYLLKDKSITSDIDRITAKEFIESKWAMTLAGVYFDAEKVIAEWDRELEE